MARVAVGSAFFLSGRDKLFVNERRKQMRQTPRRPPRTFLGFAERLMMESDELYSGF